MNNFLLGFAVASLLIALFTIFLLYKKDTATTNNEYDGAKIVSKNNKGSNIENNITPTYEATEPKKGLISRIKLRRKNKLKN